QKFAGMTVEVKYSRPSLKGRSVFGTRSDMAPVDKIWRLGANYATTIRYTEPVQIDDRPVDSGTYAMYAIPGSSSWELILNKGIKNWGAYGYKEEDDVLRFKARVKTVNDPVETFTIQFANVTNESVSVQVGWGRTQVTFPVQH